MRKHPFIWIVACLLCLAGAWFFWPREKGRDGSPSRPHAAVAPAVRPYPQSVPATSNILTSVSTKNAASAKTNKFAFRLSNTTKTISQLTGDRHAILLENAFIDTGSPLNLSIPKHLQSPGDPGAYIVQARGPIGNAFRAMLAAAGAEIVSYIPNNAYLVRAPSGVATGLTGNSLVQAVVPYEPYYKISSSMSVTAGQRTSSAATTKTNRAAGPSLLDLALGQKPLPAGTYLTLGLFSTGATNTVAQIEKLGGKILAHDKSPFGPVVRVQPPADWVALASLPGVQIVEPLHQRVHANDLSRVTVGVATDPQTVTNYLGLSGKNVIVEVNDSGIDANHPDLKPRVSGDLTLPSLVDTNGHGTHVAGTIAGNGWKSYTVTNAQGSIMPGTNTQFRGMATNATLYSVAAINDTFNALNVSDQYLQEAPAQTNALISNNSWNYSGDTAYDLAAASYDAAVRDALPGVTGSQPVLFVFSAGDDGSGGNADTIMSPATAKNVITVGALEQARYITNIVTDLNSNQTEYWYPKTASSSQVADYSSLGNVGVGTEGDNGRFKPDLVAPGSFVISTRSSEWDEMAYYNPTNYNITEVSDYVNSGSENFYSLLVPSNVVQIVIELYPNIASPSPFPNLPIYLWKGTDPRVSPPDLTGTGSISIPPDSTLTPIGAGWSYAVSNNTSAGVSYDLFVDIVTTNDNGNYFQVLSNLNDSLDGNIPPHYYRYESGTSMAAADVSGVLALMQEFFTSPDYNNGPTPSPALLKALLINGARLGVGYTYEIQNPLNYEGWGLINLPDSLPPGVTNLLSSACASFFVDQSPTNALATGDSHTYLISIPPDSDGQLLPLRITLAWTDPPGDPAAAIKLVNSLELVVSNADTGDVFYGNDIAGGNTYNTPETTNTSNYDTINNVQNVFIPYPLGTQYLITVVGRSVNVNAVTAQTNTYAINGPPGTYAPNVVQDYALVISCGEGEVTNAFKVTDNGPGLGIVSNPTTDQQITYVVSPDAPYINQLAGASTPLLGTNIIQLTTNGTELNGIQLNPTNLPFVTNIITLGMTNQWHFYVMTNPGPADFTNAAFITFIPDTLSIPRMGVFADSTANATRPEADIDLYVSTDPTLINLNPIAISNADKSVGRGGTEFVYYTDSAPGKVYYVGVYSEDQQAAEYGFIPIFTDIPFSQMNSNGTQVVNGLTLPMYIPDGSAAHPGVGYVFALAIYPMDVQRVVVTNSIAHQNFGDLIGTLSHGGNNGLSGSVVLNNHDSLGNTYGPPPRTFIYDDSGQNDIFNSQPSDGPGSLNSYVGQQAIGPWILTEVDDSLTQTGAVTGFNLLIEPHQDLGKGVYGTVGPLGWWYGYIDLPPGIDSLTISATNITPQPSLNPPLELYIKSNGIPTLTDTNEYGPVGLTNSGPTGPGNSITINSPAPSRYWVGLYNGSVQSQNFYLIATLGLGTVPQATYTSSGPVPILDDAVTTADLNVPVDAIVNSVEVALRVDHPRVSDLVFHLISPDGTRVLLVENRGGTSTQGMGSTVTITNVAPITVSGGAAPNTNVITTASANGTLTITYNFYTVPDEMVVYDQGGNLIFDSGMISGSGVFNIPYANSTTLTIIMNPGGNPNLGTGWDYTVNSLQSGYNSYLVLTEDTNKTTTPIKFAPTPFVPVIPPTTNALAWHSSFEGMPNQGSVTGYFVGWHVDSGEIDLYAAPAYVSSNIADEGTNYVDMDGFLRPATISTNVPTVPGRIYTLTFAYSQNPDGRNNGYPAAGMNVLENTNLLLTLWSTNAVNSWASLGWATTSVVFTATATNIHLAFQSIDPDGDSYGILLDCVDLTTSDLNDGFENTYAGDYTATGNSNPGFGSWTVTTNQVTVISNATLACQGTNLLALADGQISRILPTVPGGKYTLSFAYRGPGAVSLWRGESNTVDSIGNNPGVPGSALAYGSAEVGRGFLLNSTNAYITAPASSTLNVGTGSGLTLDAWIDPNNVIAFHPLFEWNQGTIGGGVGVNLWIGRVPGDSGILFANVIDAGGNSHQLYSTVPTVVASQFQHYAMTYDRASGYAKIYLNGSIVVSNLVGSFVAQTSYPFYICRRPNDVPGNWTYGSFFNGLMDEPTLYNRALSDSEIQAIYQKGSAGKYNTNAPSIALGLAEAQVSVGSNNPTIYYGNNTNWQIAYLTFTATSTNTPLTVTGIEPGMLLDNFVMAQIATNNYDLYYLPEQSLDTVKGEDALGDWQLEIQDDRAGAGLTNSLVSWQLHFIFTEPATTYTSLTNSLPLTNNVCPNNTASNITYYTVYVPANADAATNILLFSTSPVDLWFNQTQPPTGGGAGDFLLLNSVTSGSATLTTNTLPPLVPGATYFLGVQNTTAGCFTNAIEVIFHLMPPPLVLPQLPEQVAYANQLFTVANAATGGTPPYTYNLTSITSGGIGLHTGIITWTPAISNAPGVYTFTNVVTDSTGQTASDIFNVLVVLTNGLPAFPGAEGSGGFAIGGRGGDVYHVINLNDDGPGSLRYGIETSSGNRTIVFDVSGTITLFSDLKINQPYITVAGQTAPGDGICLQGLLTSVEHTHDVQVRFLRCRPGDLYAPYFQDDSFHFYYATNSIVDHVSASWSIDEVLSTTLSTNVTIQWCMIAEPLNHSAHLQDSGAPGYQEHGYGSLIRYGSGAVSYHHNLYADNWSRNPRLGDDIQLDFINNVVFNWGIFCGYNEDDSAYNPDGYSNFMNSIGNYFIAGGDLEADPGVAFQSNVPSAADTQIYQATNFIDSNPYSLTLDGVDTGWSMFSGTYTPLPGPTPMPEIQVTNDEPALAYEQVLDFAGASVAGTTVTGSLATATSLLRDPVDVDIVAGVRNKSGQIIDFISANNFPGVYLITNYGVASGGYSGAASYWNSQGYNTFVGMNPWPILNPAPQPLDSDGDGIPDYWEITLAATGVASMNPAVPNNNHSNPDGYTDLEHYINWLAAPHALTVSNTPVAVDLYAIAGRTGNLSFSVANGINGTVTLTNSIATFTPSNNYFGFASFDFYVTNLDTANGFGPVTVSVMVSVTNIVTSSVLLADTSPQTNTVAAGKIAYYLVTVPTNADMATNILVSSTAPVNLLFSRVGFPTGTNTGDYTLLANSTNGSSVLSTTSMPTNIIPGGSYYLGVQNTGGAPATFVIEVNFHYPAPTLPVSPISGLTITRTNISGTNGFLLQWQGPTNLQYEIQWTASLTPVAWNVVLDPVINVTVTATNGHFSWFDDGSLTGGLGPMKFYRLVSSLNLGTIFGPEPATNTVLAGTMSQAVITVPSGAISANNLLISATGPLNVWFDQNQPPTGNTNAGDFLMLSTSTGGNFVLTTNSVPPLVPGASYYLGFQNPGTSNVTFVFQVTFGFPPPSPPVSSFSITTTNGGLWLKWNGLTNYQYQVQWTASLQPPVTWHTVSNIVLTSTTGIFTFFDNGSLTGGFGPEKFYRLIVWPFMTPIPQTLSFSSVTVTNIGGTNDLTLKWSAPTNYNYGIRWTTNLALPFSSWSVLASPVLTQSNGVYTFIDNGQTGPPTAAKFFRLFDY
jgi:subtilisin-like proprotein convertase family protein